LKKGMGAQGFATGFTEVKYWPKREEGRRTTLFVAEFCQDSEIRVQKLHVSFLLGRKVRGG
jgi:hypothetical protein